MWAKREALAIGETPNIAARLQGLAEPNTVVISAATQRLVQGLFECQELGLQRSRASRLRCRCTRCYGESALQSRFEVAVRTGLTPLVGREQELGLLRGISGQQAKAGEGQIVLLNGEPGIGKSRLLQELKERLAADYARVEFRCSPFYQNRPSTPSSTTCSGCCSLPAGHPHRPSSISWSSALESYRFLLLEVVPLLAPLLSLPLPAALPPLTPSPRNRSKKPRKCWSLDRTGSRCGSPCAVAVEDLHWADPSTLEFSRPALDQMPTARLLVLLTARPEFRSALAGVVLSDPAHPAPLGTQAG